MANRDHEPRRSPIATQWDVRRYGRPCVPPAKNPDSATLVGYKILKRNIPALASSGRYSFTANGEASDKLAKNFGVFGTGLRGEIFAIHIQEKHWRNALPNRGFDLRHGCAKLGTAGRLPQRCASLAIPLRGR